MTGLARIVAPRLVTELAVDGLPGDAHRGPREERYGLTAQVTVERRTPLAANIAEGLRSARRRGSCDRFQYRTGSLGLRLCARNSDVGVLRRLAPLDGLGDLAKTVRRRSQQGGGDCHFGRPARAIDDWAWPSARLDCRRGTRPTTAQSPNRLIAHSPQSPDRPIAQPPNRPTAYSSRISLAQMTITTTETTKITVATAFTSGVMPPAQQPPDLQRHGVLPANQEEGDRDLVEAQGEHQQRAAQHRGADGRAG